MPTRTEVTVEDGDEQEQDQSSTRQTRRRDPGDTRTPVDVHIQQHRSARRAVRWLDSELERAKEDIARLRKNSGKVPDGGRILTKEEVDRFDAYQKIGLEPDRLATVVTEHGTYKARVQESDAAGLVKAAGFKPLVVKLAKGDGGRLEARDVTETVDGKRVTNSVLHVVFGEGDNVTATPVTDYAEQHWKDDLDDIKLPSENKSPTRTTPGRNGSTVTGSADKAPAGPQGGERARSYHTQAPAGAATDDDAVVDYQRSVRIRPGQAKA